MSSRDVEAVLAGAASYDDLSDRDQAAARTILAERQDALREALNFAEEFRAQGVMSWVAGDPQGNVVMRGPSHE